MSKVYITSDLHLGHVNMVRKYRNLTDVEKHDQMIINNWNNIINKNDKVFLLGDLSLEKNVADKIALLKGNIILIPGNHEKVGHVLNIYSKLNNIKGIGSLIKYKGYWLSHAPIHPNELRGKKNIHGHVHKSYIKKWFNLVKDKRYINVCMDITNYKPVEFTELVK